MNLILDTLMAFITFGSVAVIFASIIGLTIWMLSKIARVLLDSS
jgi:hypothetical protein